MGKLIKNHLARLLTLTAGAYHVLASIEGFFWPKVLWDWSTKLLDPAVKPIPILQIINLLIGLTVLSWEWPLGAIAGTLWHRSIEARLFFLPLASLAAVLLYQGTNAAIYYLVCEAVWFVAFADGEEVAEKPWSLPKKKSSSKREKA